MVGEGCRAISPFGHCHHIKSTAGGEEEFIVADGIDNTCPGTVGGAFVPMCELYLLIGIAIIISVGDAHYLEVVDDSDRSGNGIIVPHLNYIE